jgi:hypothetical protein
LFNSEQRKFAFVEFSATQRTATITVNVSIHITGAITKGQTLMNKAIVITLSAILSLSISASAIAWEQPSPASEVNDHKPPQRAIQNDTRQYQIGLKPGQHLVIVNAPARKLIRFDTQQRQTVDVQAAVGSAVPFVHIKIEKPLLSQPLQQFSSL